MFSGNDTAIDSWTQDSCVHKTGSINKGSPGPTPGNVGSHWVLQEGLSLCLVVEQLIRCPCLRELCEKGGVKILRVSGDESHQGKNAFRYNRTGADRNSEKLAACTDPAQVPNRWSLSAERRSRHEPPFLIQKLLQNVNYLPRENWCFPVKSL